VFPPPDHDGTCSRRRVRCWKRLVAADGLGAGAPVANSQCAINNRGNRDIMGHDENSYSQFFVSWRMKEMISWVVAESSSPVGSSAVVMTVRWREQRRGPPAAVHRRRAGRVFSWPFGQANDLQQFGGAASVARAADTLSICGRSHCRQWSGPLTGCARSVARHGRR